MFASFRPAGKDGDFNAYILRSYRKDGGGTSTMTVEKLGRLSDIKREHPGHDPRQWVEQRARMLTEQEESESSCITLVLDPGKRMGSGDRRVIHGGELLLHGLYYELGLDSICAELTRRGKFSYDINDIMKKLVYGRILFPDSKLGTWEQSRSFVNPPAFELEDIYKALGVMARESDMIQGQLYLNTVAGVGRNTTVIYYDCTNYYFEVEQADKEAEECADQKELRKYKARGLRKYGHSKENRPSPIVQLGMFMDGDGMPLAFCVNPGNTSENKTIQPLEETLATDFGLSTFVCCTDGGLGSRDNRRYNRTEGREYITVQSLKGTKVDPAVREWALEDSGWTVPGHEGVHTKKEAAALLGDRFREATLVKDRHMKVGKDGDDEHIIVTYSQKYADYMKKTRDAQVARAARQIAAGTDLSKKSPNDCRRFIKQEKYTDDGVEADRTLVFLDEEKIAEEARFDGIYAIATSLDDTPSAVLKANHFRYEIEHLFRVTKTDLDLRPIYLSRTDRIIGHFVTCFIALLMLKMLQRKVNAGRAEEECVPVERIRESLAGMKYVYHESAGYEPAFNNNATTLRMQEALNIIVDNQIISKPRMRSLLAKPHSPRAIKRIRADSKDNKPREKP